MDKTLLAYGFKQIPETQWLINRRENMQDVDFFSHVLRIDEVHYLFFSTHYSRFSMAVKNEGKKGKAGGGMDEYRSIMIPKLITNENIVEFLNGIL